MPESTRNNSVKPTLWTKNFTILTVGSVISMIGNSLAGFAMSLLVLDQTKSDFLYAIYLVMFTLPQIITPIFSGAILDRFSRRKTIYTLDFTASVLYLVAGLVLMTGFFNFTFLAVFCFLLGIINSFYMVAYESFYPLLITPGYFSKAYSISSVLETLSQVMIPVSALVYNLIGITPLFIINACCMFTAAVIETRIDAPEQYIEKQKAADDGSKSFSVRMFSDIKEGFKYIISEKGLLFVSVYFAIISFAGGASQAITLPYFKNNFSNGEYIYIIVWGMQVVGRSIGGLVLYKIKLKRSLKFRLALTSYVTLAVLEGIYLYTSLPFMMASCLVIGLLGVTSYTIRTSSTQNYVPDEKKGRYNGAFNMLCTGGSTLGQLLAGALTIVFSERLTLSSFMAVNLIAALVLILGNKRHIKKVYEYTGESTLRL